MLISEFSRATGLPADTVRYYVRRGILRPGAGARGGRNPYQVFGEADVRVAGFVRLGQALGLSLAEIGALVDEERSGRIDDARSVDILAAHRERLSSRVSELSALVAYLDAKIAWVGSGGVGPQPQIAEFALGGGPPPPAL